MFPTSVLTLDGSGRGNNWAHGFTESAGMEEISDGFRKVVEQDSRLGGTMILSSVGTLHQSPHFRSIKLKL